MLEAIFSAEDWQTKAVFAGVIILVSVLASDLLSQLRLSWRLRKYPVINPTWGNPKAQAEFHTNANNLIRKGVELFKGKPFRINDFSQSGAKLLLSPKYIEEYKSHPMLDFGSFVGKDFYSTYPGFEPFTAATNGVVFQEAIRTQLAQVIALTVIPMAQELPKTLDMVLGKPQEWTEVHLQRLTMRCVARLTSLIFLGEKFMDDPDWQRICQEYTIDAFLAAQRLNDLPPFLRPVVHWFLPECRRIRWEVKRARQLIEPEVERRVEELRKHGKPRRHVLDSIDWFVAAAKGQPYDIGVAEISLAMASIHTTSRTIMTLMHDLIRHPEYTQDLRDEVVEVVKETGKMDKTALFKMKKMDSFFRESTRLHNFSDANMARLAIGDITFSDGTVVPRGTYTMIAPVPMKDPEVYPDPDEFDAYRHLRMRDRPDAENKHQAVTTSPTFTFWGHGQHACPGRFFAANEIKLLFTYMILHYDFDLPEGADFPVDLPAGMGTRFDPMQKLLYRARTPELDMMKYCELPVEDASA